MPRKKTRKPNVDPVSYIVTISSYATDYSISLGTDWEEAPYSRSYSITIEGKLTITTSKKISQGTPVKMQFLSSDAELDPKFKPTCVGTLSNYKDRLQAYAILESRDVHYLLSILATGKAEVLNLYGSELYHNKSKLTSIRLTTNFEWEDWEEPA